MPIGSFEFGTNPQLTKMFIDALSDIFEPKVSRKARQTREAMEQFMSQRKAGGMAPGTEQEYARAFQYDPGFLRRMFRPSERAPEYLLSEAPFEVKVKTPKGGIAPVPIDIPRPPVTTGEDLVGQADSITNALAQRGINIPFRDIFSSLVKGGLPETDEEVDNRVDKLAQKYNLTSEQKREVALGFHGAKLAVPEETEEEKFGGFKKREEFKAGLRPPIETPEEKLKGFKERETFKEGLRKGRPEKEKKEPLPPGTDVNLRAALLRIYLSNSNVWGETKEESAKVQRDAVNAVREGKLEDAYFLLNPDQQRTFEEVITIAEGYARKLGITGAVNQALHELRVRRPSAFQRQGGTQPPSPIERKGITTPSGKTYTIEEVP